ncbi:MAG TPA: SIR2 family protein [Thermoanaerobaculia bacterium]|nr:SIR2 family protein [Thermoanaerobaculia bacterium]
MSCLNYEGLPLGKDVTAKLIEDLTGLKIQRMEDLCKVEASPVFKRLLDEYEDLGRLKVYDLGRVALHASARRRRRSFIELLQEILPDRKRKPSRLLTTLARLPVPLIVTTNYDRLMEQALREAPLLRPSPPRDPLVLIEKLGKVDDPLAQLLRHRFAPHVGGQLEDPETVSAPSPELRRQVVSEMARLMDDIRDPSGLAGKLRAADDPVSAHLRAQLPEATVQSLEALQAPEPPSSDLLQSLADGLNIILLQDTHFHELKALSDVELPLWARKLRRQGPEGDNLLRLNRLLLGKVYPQEIAEIHVSPMEVVVQPLEGFRGAEQEAVKRRLAEHDGVVLYKIHGSFFDEEPPEGFPPVVITEEDYIQFLTLIGRADGSIPQLIKDKFAFCSLLFLGYGLEDWDFRTLYKGLIQSVPPNKQRESFAIQYDPPEYWVRYWEPNVFIYDMDIYEFADELEQRWRAFLASPE